MNFDINSMVGWIFLMGLVCLTGCRTADQADSGHMASVAIYGHTTAEIEQATAAAFIENGYYKIGDLTFEKKGSAWETANYGGWSSDRVWIKVRAELISMDGVKFTLSCDAYVVEGHGHGGVEMERKFTFAKRSECKAILDEIKAALNRPR